MPRRYGPGMSLYNHLMDGFSESLTVAAFLLKLKEPALFQSVFPRFRDTHAALVPGDDRAFVVTVMTRSGGPNRESFSDQIAAVRLHNDFVSDRDCPWDSTFMYFVFQCQLPPSAADLASSLRAHIVELGLEKEDLPMDRYWELLQLMESSPGDPRAIAALERGARVMEPVFSKIKESADPINMLEIGPVLIPDSGPDEDDAVH